MRSRTRFHRSDHHLSGHGWRSDVLPSGIEYSLSEGHVMGEQHNLELFTGTQSRHVAAAATLTKTPILLVQVNGRCMAVSFSLCALEAAASHIEPASFLAGGRLTTSRPFLLSLTVPGPPLSIIVIHFI